MYRQHCVSWTATSITDIGADHGWHCVRPRRRFGTASVVPPPTAASGTSTRHGSTWGQPRGKRNSDITSLSGSDRPRLLHCLVAAPHHRNAGHGQPPTRGETLHAPEAHLVLMITNGQAAALAQPPLTAVLRHRVVQATLMLTCPTRQGNLTAAGTVITFGQPAAPGTA